MTSLHQLKNHSRPKKKIQRVGRGPGSKRGKTSCRGHKGDKSRSGYKRREGKEGGQLPLFRKLPTRGFTRGRFLKEHLAINLGMIEALYNEGETVNFTSLFQKGLASRQLPGGIKILGGGELTKKVKIEAHAFSKSALEKLEKGPSTFKKIPLGNQSE